ncbi:thiol:disulfide interchange protein DsbD [Advenella faeciporci]|uniref:Thiol:disulfide interchange protein DsbD n=1 Tax=Advenella faeciporci TaxID=797535 RepID=A0A918JKG1_9BURK|nr:protein-disulfide reductase DsbD [Advenella faeciporci]GGW84411.1 thiol:disulfide interchange protein DsbD [Advenella faeciporci]
MIASLYKKILWLFSVFTLFFFAALSPLQAEEDFLAPEKAFVFSAQMQTDNLLKIRFDIAPKYYMYRERFEYHIKDDNDSATQAGMLLGKPIYPSSGQIKYDPTFDKEMEVYYNNVEIQLPLNQGSDPFTLELIGQGCADAGLCYPPMTYEIGLSPTATGYEITAGEGVLLGGPPALSASNNNNISLFDAGDTDIAAWLGDASLLKIILLSFALGVLLSFTPCVLPMLPILLSIVVGDRKAGHAAVSRFRGLNLTLMYVLGTSVVYTILGILAASIGAVMASWIQNPWVLGLFAVVLVILAIGMFGAFTIQMPASLQSSLNEKVSRMPGGRMGNAFFMGIISALICGPCVAAPLAGVLLFISQTGDLTTGGLALFVLAWGQGTSLLILGTSSGALLPKAGPWMDSIKNFCGLLLLATAVWMIMPITPGWFNMLAWAFLSMCLALLLGAFNPLPNNNGILKLLFKATGLLFALWAILLILGLAAGGQSVLSPLKGLSAGNSQASAERGNTAAVEKTPFVLVKTLAELENTVANAGKPVMLDFYADWCISCKEMELFTFSDPTVRQKLGQMLLLQVDVTKNNEADRELLKRFKLFGPPGIVFFNKQGQELEKIRVVGFQNAEKFSGTLDKVLN